MEALGSGPLLDQGVSSARAISDIVLLSWSEHWSQPAPAGGESSPGHSCYQSRPVKRLLWAMV